jgi:hypothetical protein
VTVGKAGDALACPEEAAGEPLGRLPGRVPDIPGDKPDEALGATNLFPLLAEGKTLPEAEAEAPGLLFVQPTKIIIKRAVSKNDMVLFIFTPYFCC